MKKQISKIQCNNEDWLNHIPKPEWFIDIGVGVKNSVVKDHFQENC